MLQLFYLMQQGTMQKHRVVGEPRLREVGHPLSVLQEYDYHL